MSDTPKVKATEEEYQRSRLRTALEFCPGIYACKKCGLAVVKGYCCGYCGDAAPYEE